ncbi:MAG: SAM-dependent chlorinase/fluorinase [Chloroflexota bacterium]|nr:SAM-dependent chlorinase/fluorinase [Chloroflexota bacterium]
MSERPVIGFLTDFGLDGAAATCRGVMLGICPNAQIVDISHTVRKYAIRDGAFILRAALPFMPVGVHVGVVDPGVGTERRPIAIRTARGDVLIGPDNGLLMPGADALGGAATARELTNRDLWLPSTTATFHGRDMFAPVAAHLAAADAEVDSVGPEIPVGDLVRLAAAEARTERGRLATEVTYIDSFGNLRLAGGRGDLMTAFSSMVEGDRFTVRIGANPSELAVFVRSFGHAPVGATVLYVDSTGDLAVADNQADLARRVGAESGTAVVIEPS